MVHDGRLRLAWRDRWTCGAIVCRPVSVVDSHDAPPPPPPGAECGMTSSLSYGQKPQKDMSFLKAVEYIFITSSIGIW